MSRRQFLQTSTFAIGASMLPTAWLSQLLAPAGEMKTLRNNVGIFTERGGTIAWMIDKEGLVVVDTQFPDTAVHLIEGIRKQNERRVDLLINTHHHGDHSGGNIAFKGIVDKVVAHKNSKANQERTAIAAKSEDKQLYPDTTYETTWSQKVGSETMSLHYFGPGHTNGDSFVHFENANVVHCGDLMFNRRFPNIDRAAGASIANWIVALGKARKTFSKDTLYVFGHGAEGLPVTGTEKDLIAMQNYLSKLLKFIKKEIKAGKTKEQILEAKYQVIPGAEEWKGQGIERSLTTAFDELMEGKSKK
ncbi:MBL fold metallo-hydrolase [Haliscomenobacter hydrossis]|uniref:Beta-lactamase domain-containing protein n=1 Tax=Haliscomenobacter hydrossis (strain ATCC 27775 / DSM 1100 / LMG 10767 / O) TaxID=760192 RepID=F4KX85_HALH1|nr:MBL fold metallo-hydrolase [Haliscomenobacter hydrossis]AEE48313.1 beta-lactamase domain-containing protein [Haliscomenobacter hydrossis DSM 1100]